MSIWNVGIHPGAGFGRAKCESANFRAALLRSLPKREVLPDPVYGTVIVTKLINQVMYDGKRGVAQAVCYSAFETVAAKSGKDAMEVFNQAIANIMPSLEGTARRGGGAP